MGTRSVLFGAHCFFIHPWFVAWGWMKLYGFPWDPRLWIAFFVHDLGYWGKPNMDGPEGETHPNFGARIMNVFGNEWYYMVMCHSRFYANRLGKEPSRLCWADKLAMALEPWWLYVPRVALTGEIHEYARAHVVDMNQTHGAVKRWDTSTWGGKLVWFYAAQEHMHNLVKHKWETGAKA